MFSSYRHLAVTNTVTLETVEIVKTSKLK